MKNEKEKFVCSNTKFKTNVAKGYNGSVTKEPIFKDEESELRLEYVIELKRPNDEIFWLMWYSADGSPIIEKSAVFKKADLLKIINSINFKDIEFL